MARPIGILMVCLGNICRSPTAEGVLRARLDAAGLSDRVRVDSAGTGDSHLGQAPDPRAIACAAGHGIDISGLRARRLAAEDFDACDLVLCADDGHFRAVQRLARGHDADVRMVREFDPEAGDDLDLADPYYGSHDDFTECLRQIRRSSDGIVEHVRAELGA